MSQQYFGDSKVWSQNVTTKVHNPLQHGHQCDCFTTTVSITTWPPMWLLYNQSIHYNMATNMTALEPRYPLQHGHQCDCFTTKVPITTWPPMWLLYNQSTHYNMATNVTALQPRYPLQHGHQKLRRYSTRKKAENDNQNVVVTVENKSYYPPF